MIKGKYRIVREIARSNDIVYEALDTSLSRRIALKELNIAPSLTGQARRERIERFNREARAAGRLSHPNIVSVFDFGEENGRHFIAMEFLEGQTLRDSMQVRSVFALKEAIDIACQVLDALGYAHTNRVIHRDIKPDNIQILPGGQVKLTDFGIARLTEEDSLTGDGQVFGTPSYMSPEQVVGRGIDYRSDLFSLAVVLYEMLSGRKPFTGDSVVSITYAIMNAPPPPLMGILPSVEQVILRALSKDPNLRQRSAEEMKNELRAAEQMPASLQPPPNAYRTGMGYGYHNTGLPVAPPFPMQGGGMTGYSGQQQPLHYGNVPQQGSYAPQQGGYAQPPSYPPNANSGLPWNFNNGNLPANNSVPPQSAQPGSQPLNALPPGANPAYPQGAAPFPRRPAAPLIVISPAARTWLVALAVAALLGTAVAAGVIGFLRSYDQYRVSAGTQYVNGLINEGVAAYNKQDYPTAAALFEKALQANPGFTERDKIIFNLSATYIQSARAMEAKNDWQAAKSYYNQALAGAPDNRTAHIGLSNALEHLGDTSGSRRERDAAQNSRDDASTPDSLNHASAASSDTSGGQDPQQFLQDQRAKAEGLIQEGDALYTKGDQDGARAKWLEAISAAPGTPERDKAQKRLDTAQP